MRAAAVVVVVALAGAADAQVIQPVAVHAPKGRPGAAIDRAAGLEFLYVGVLQGVAAHGAEAMILQAQPAVAGGDYHSLAEIAVQSDNDQIVEIGWTVDRQTNGDDLPHLFAFHWIDGKPQCYNGCGWVQVSPTVRPGMRVTPGEAHHYEIREVAGDWWLAYDGERMGYFPGSRWKGRFTETTYVQWFGEVAAQDRTPCTQMGNGKPGDDPDAAAFSAIEIFDAADAELAASVVAGRSNETALYRIGELTPTSFRFGGAGAASCCVVVSCAEMGAECGELQDPRCGGTVQCGSCGDGVTCGADHTCTAPGTDRGGGGCDAGGASGAAWLLAGLGVVGLRRRAKK
jgi:hypothetical protein